VWAFSSRSGSTPAPSASCEAAMFELVLGLAVVAGLAIYLVVTLIAPERF
jgi:K+-transporting ATPase KdpF subunit